MLPEKSIHRIAGWLGLTAAAVGLVTLTGWLLGADPLRWVRLEPYPVRANTAFCLFATGLALWSLQRGALKKLATLSAGVALALSLLTLIEHFANVNLRIDEWLVRDGSVRTLVPHPGRMSPANATAFFVTSIALLLLCGKFTRNRRLMSSVLSTLVGALSLTSLLLQSLSSATSGQFTHILRTGSHVSFGLLLISIGLLILRTKGRFLQSLFAQTPTGILARRLFYGTAVAPALIGAALIFLLKFNIVGLIDGVGLFTIALITSGISIALLSLDAATELDDRRNQAESARLHLTARLQEQAAQLQETVSLRTCELREVNASLRAAAEANARLALVANHATNGVVICDAQGRVEWINASYERMTGYTTAEMRGQKPGHLLQGAATDPVAAAKMRAAVRLGEACAVEILNYTKLGVPYWVIVDIQPVRDARGQLINFISVQTDITAQRRAQGMLEMANRRMLLATQAAELGVWEDDFDANRCDWDDRMLALYGLTRATFHGTYAEWTSRLHPEDAEEAQRTLRLIQDGAESFDRTFRIIRADDGAVRTLRSRAIARRDAAGRLLGCTGAERDVTIEREANQRLVDLNERLQLALRSSQFGVWETDLATGRMHWDDRMLEICGVTRAEFDGKRATWEQTLHPEDRAAALAKNGRAFSGEDSFYVNEFRIVRPDGTVRHIEAHGQLLRDDAGKPLRLVGLNRDISLERKTEAALHLVEERWQLALEGNNDGVWDWDVATDHFFYDTRYCVMLGFALGELPNHSAGHFKLLHPDDREEFEKENQAHLDGRIPFFQHEHRMQAKSGEWVWILDRAKVVSRAPDGRPLRMVGTHTDITARKHLEHRLRQAEELSQQVGQLAQIGGWELKLASGQLTFTEGARRIHELASDEPTTLEQVLAFFPIEARETLKAALSSRTLTAPSFDFELPFNSSKGRSLWVRVIGHAEFREGRAVSLRGALQDISSRHESEGARRELEGQLFQAQKMETLGTLAGGIAHDFNNLLTGIIGYHELAADTIPEDHPARACLNEARGASMRARDLVEQILTFSRQSAGEEHEAVDLTLVLKEAGRFLRATLAANVIIETDIPDDVGRVLANTTQIYQVLLNLGSNAAHAMRPNGGTLRISLQPTDVGAERPGALSSASPGRYLRLDVSDTGHGMDEATLRRIFDPFFTTKNTREGTGLGLAVVHGIIRAHRGAIDVESTPGTGTIFRIYLPVAEQTVAPDPGDHVNAPAGHGQLVYVVDDEELVGRFIKLALVGVGYEVQAFTSAESCLAAFDLPGAKCDLLLTDQTMPGQQGTELATVIQARLPDLPVIIMSGYFSKVPTQSLGELRNAHLLAKPFTTDELAHALNRAWQLATIRPA
jgi:PAS domain S-box-containing protein